MGESNKEHFQKPEIRPLFGRYVVGGIFIGPEQAGWPGFLDDTVAIRWIFSNLSNASVIKESALDKTQLRSTYPYKLTYRPLTDRDDVQLGNPYSSSVPPVVPIARISIPIDLHEGLFAVHEVLVVRNESKIVPDLILGMDFLVKHGFIGVSYNSSDNGMKFVKRE